MKVALLADTHGFLPELEPCDLVIHAGDICPVSDHSEAMQFSWLTTNFALWLNDQPCQEIIYVAGNHDFFFEGHKWVVDRALKHIGGTYLRDQAYEVNGYKIWGSPWQPWFHNWAFNIRSVEELAQKWSLIPDDTEILITHGPPYGILDVEGFGKTNAGCPALRKRISELKDLRLHVFGHIHHSFGQYVGENNEWFVNASYVDEGYKPRPQAPVYLTLPDK
jgi:Icc-related predicted phosphoesterase